MAAREEEERLMTEKEKKKEGTSEEEEEGGGRQQAGKVEAEAEPMVSEMCVRHVTFQGRRLLPLLILSLRKLGASGRVETT